MATIVQLCNKNQGFLSAILSLFAIIAAVGIPAFIAHRQNKIALFDKSEEVLTYIRNLREDWLYLSVRKEALFKNMASSAEICDFVIRHRFGRGNETLFYCDTRSSEENYRLIYPIFEEDTRHLQKMKRLFIFNKNEKRILDETIQITRENSNKILGYLFVDFENIEKETIMQVLEAIFACIQVDIWGQIINKMEKQVLVKK